LILLMQQQPELFGQAMSVLHVAPERHVREVLLRRRPRRYVTADLSSRDVKVRLDITRLPFPDASFDLVLCNHVLEHVQEDTKAMRELLRVLTPGGRSIPQVPIGLALDHTREDPAITDPRDRERLFGQEDHVRIYGPDYPARLEKAGFTVEVVSPRALLGARQVEDCGASPDEEVFLCSKQL
jgi:SAM-dependent methyltransferase